ncbi:MAG: gliding motility-associated C-terminal domain-containing protein [Saprospiraceae bacterium]
MKKPILAILVLFNCVHCICQPILYKCQGENIIINDVTYSQPGSYLIKYKDMNGLDSNVFVQIVDRPIYYFASALQVCKGDTFNGQIYTQDTVLTETYKTIYGCDSIISIEINVRAFNIDSIMGNKHLCEGEKTVLSVGNYNNIRWSTGAQSKTIEVAFPGIYAVTITDSEGCVLNMKDQITASDFVLDLDIVNISCKDEAMGIVDLNYIDGGVEPYQVWFDDNLLTEDYTINGLNAGFYSLKIQDAQKCVIDSIIQIDQPETTFIVNLDTDKNEYRQGEEIIIQSNSSHTIVNNEWQCENCDIIEAGESLSLKASEVADNVKVVGTFTDMDGCQTKVESNLKLLKKFGIVAPNIFTPNDDGINDAFMLGFDPDVTLIKEMSIFDRFGNVVFKQQDILPEQVLWDGIFSGQKATPGVYTVFINYQTIRLDIKKYIASLTIL